MPIYGLYYSTMVHLFTGIYVRKLSILIPFTTGTLITEKYSSFYSEKHKNNLNDKFLEQKVEK